MNFPNIKIVQKTLDDDGKYVGQLNEDDRPHGIGVLIDEDGNVQEGQWKNGEQYGLHKSFAADGAYYSYIQYNSDGK